MIILPTKCHLTILVNVPHNVTNCLRVGETPQGKIFTGACAAHMVLLAILFFRVRDLGFWPYELVIGH